MGGCAPGLGGRYGYMGGRAPGLSGGYRYMSGRVWFRAVVTDIRAVSCWICAVGGDVWTVALGVEIDWLSALFGRSRVEIVM